MWWNTCEELGELKGIRDWNIRELEIVSTHKKRKTIESWGHLTRMEGVRPVWSHKRRLRKIILGAAVDKPGVNCKNCRNKTKWCGDVNRLT